MRKAFLGTGEEPLATWECQASEDAALDPLSSPALIKPMEVPGQEIMHYVTIYSRKEKIGLLDQIDTDDSGS